MRYLGYVAIYFAIVGAGAILSAALLKLKR